MRPGRRIAAICRSYFLAFFFDVFFGFLGFLAIGVTSTCDRVYGPPVSTEAGQHDAILPSYDSIFSSENGKDLVSVG
jgi:hypothetical protein